MFSVSVILSIGIFLTNSYVIAILSTSSCLDYILMIKNVFPTLQFQAV